MEMQRLLQLAKDNSSLAIKKVKVIVTIFSIVQVCEKLVSYFYLSLSWTHIMIGKVLIKAMMCIHKL